MRGEAYRGSIAVINKCCGHAHDFQLRCGCGRLKRTTGSVKSPLSRPRNRDKASAGTNVRHIRDVSKNNCNYRSVLFSFLFFPPPPPDIACRAHIRTPRPFFLVVSVARSSRRSLKLLLIQAWRSSVELVSNPASRDVDDVPRMSRTRAEPAFSRRETSVSGRCHARHASASRGGGGVHRSPGDRPCEEIGGGRESAKDEPTDWTA